MGFVTGFVFWGVRRGSAADLEGPRRTLTPGGSFGDEHRETPDFQYGFGVMTRLAELADEVGSPTSPIGEGGSVDERFD